MSMDNSGEVAERIVRISMDGAVYAMKISGVSTKYLVSILISATKEENKTKGLMRLQNMLRQDKELKVFTLSEDQFKSFRKEVKRFGVTYSVLCDKDRSKNHPIEIMVKAEDASKIQRIFERLNFGKIDTAEVEADIEKAIKDIPAPSGKTEIENNSTVSTSNNKNELEKEQVNHRPFSATTSPSHPSEPTSEKQKIDGKGLRTDSRKSVREIISEIVRNRKEKYKSGKELYEPALSASKLKKGNEYASRSIR
jgi:hypothetical protein